MSVETIFGLCASGLVGLGLYGLIVQSHPFRKILSFNLLGSGIFVIFGVIARRGGSDPVPHALVITGIVVAFSATALAIALVRRLMELSNRSSLDDREDE